MLICSLTITDHGFAFAQRGPNVWTADWKSHWEYGALRSIVDALHEGNGKCYYFVYLITNSKYCRDFIDIVVWNIYVL